MKELKKEIRNKAIKEIADWAESEHLIKRFSTDYTYNKYKDGEITQEKAYKNAYNRMVKSVYKVRDKRLSLLEEIENSQEIEMIRISVDWKKSPTCGMNPHATVSAYSADNCYTAESKASGGGYDKESQAIANALNEIDGIRKLLIKKLDYINEKKPYGINQYGIIPAFSGGVGTNLFTSFFRDIGWTVTEMHGKTYDSYVITRGGKDE